MSGFSEILGLAVASPFSCLCQGFDLQISMAQQLCPLRLHMGGWLQTSVIVSFPQQIRKERKDKPGLLALVVEGKQLHVPLHNSSVNILSRDKWNMILFCLFL